MPSDIENTPDSEKDVEEYKGASEERSSPTPTDNHDTKASAPAVSSEGDTEGDKGDTNNDKPSDSQAQWQAIFSPQYNAYYFYNEVTQEVTWTNPLEPEASGSASAAVASSSSSHVPEEISPEGTNKDSAEAGTSGTGNTTTAGPMAQYAALQAAALAQGIDPALAHLDPSLLAPSVPGSSRGPGDLPSFSAQFNARTGAFAPANSRTPGHLSEHERAKRMSEFYFDVNKWEQDLAAQGGSIRGGEEEDGTGKKRKRPTKKDLERFKEQKRLKKIAKTAWLRT